MTDWPPSGLSIASRLEVGRVTIALSGTFCAPPAWVDSGNAKQPLTLLPINGGHGKCSITTVNHVHACDDGGHLGAQVRGVQHFGFRRCGLFDPERI